MSGGIFVLHDDGRLDEMNQCGFKSEALLQELIATYPNLLAGDQMNSEKPKKWLLVSREMSVPDEEDGTGRWSLDHLFLDQDAIPTLVEVKRSSDPRLRREVVGQMLDYAANAVLNLSVEAIRAAYEKTCQTLGMDSAINLSEFLENSIDADVFWNGVKTNLQAGKIRLIFVADEIPKELARIVEFLNQQMNLAEVLAVEVKQYAGEGTLKTLVPRLIGQTAMAQQRKEVKTTRPEKIDEATFLDEMLRIQGVEEQRSAKGIVEWAKKQNLRLNFNKLLRSVSFIPILQTEEGPRYPISLSSQGGVWIQMRWLRAHRPFNDERKREELWCKLNSIPGIEIALNRMVGFPSVTLQTLVDEAVLHQFLEAMTWLVTEARTFSTTQIENQIDTLK